MPQESERTPAPNHKPDLEVGITVGAGNVHQFEVSEQVNAMIGRFLATAA